MYDLLIMNGLVIDGSGAERFRADVAVENGKIAAVGDLASAEAKEVFDAEGLVVAPGFIDAHSHADFNIAACPIMDSALRQGVTTLIPGQCGISMAPLLDETRDEVTTSLEPRKMPIEWEKWSDFDSYLTYLDDLGLGLNVIPLVGHGAIRGGVMGFSDREPTEAELAEMARQVGLAMDAGALGMSTGLIYPPGSFSKTDELIAISKPIGERGGFYFSHIRNEGPQLLESLEEAVTIGRETGAKVHISHLKASWQDNWHKMKAALEIIDKANAEGIKTAADMYPYTAGSTGLKTVLPYWAQEGGTEATLARLADGPTRERMVADMSAGDSFCDAGAWDRVMISRAGGRPEYSGKFVAELAAQAGKSPEDWIFDTLLETKLDVGMITFMIDEDNVRLGLSHPKVIIGSDSVPMPDAGPHAQGCPHPRGFGTFVRVLGKYCRDEKLFSLEEGVNKMTGRTAALFGLTDRGLIKEGMVADLAVFNPETIIDQAQYGDSFHFPLGVEYVIVAGVPAVAKGQYTGAKAGRVLRRSGLWPK